MKTKTLIAPVTLLLAGCANFNSVHRDLNISNGNGALIDIKQRAIIASIVKIKKDNVETTETRVCAEPSPDALSAYAAELAAKADNGHVAAGLSAAFQEGSAFVGLRTQSIQLLRDSSYRLCESYLNGAIDKDEYGWLLRRFQRNMLALLAVEQLTGAVRVPTITIGTEGSASAARALRELLAEQEKIDANIKQLEEENAKPENADNVTKNNEKIARLKTNKKAIEGAITNARDLPASGQSTVSVYNFAQPSEKTDSQLQIVAKAVENIVKELIGQNDLGALCFSYLKSKNGTANTSDDLANSCIAYLSGAGATVQADTNVPLADQPQVPELKSIKRSNQPAHQGVKK